MLLLANTIKTPTQMTPKLMNIHRRPHGFLMPAMSGGMGPLMSLFTYAGGVIRLISLSMMNPTANGMATMAGRNAEAMKFFQISSSVFDEPSLPSSTKFK